MKASLSCFTDSLFNAVPRTLPALDPGFRPLSLGLRAYKAALEEWPSKDRVCIALEGTSSAVSRQDLEIFPEAAGRQADNLQYVGWILNFLLWSRGGWRVVLSGPEDLCRALAADYASGGPRAFDADLMGQAFGKCFEFQVVAAAEVPAASSRPVMSGGHLDGCRIGFDLGASDYKVAAVKDGEAVFSEELPWNPKVEPDPAYHYERIQAGLKLAASHLPRVDAIGGSSAGILMDNQVMVASLFRAVPPGAFLEQVRPLFLRLQSDWGVPLEVINDGDVTALAGALSLGLTGVLGIAMGSSEAAGFLDRDGRITGWLNELAFAPVDANPEAGTDDWSGNPGIGAAYFSQQAVNKLAGPAGLSFPKDMGLPERLLQVQSLMAQGAPAARAIFETIGVYLGYVIPWYAEFYDMEHAMILGRVTSGPGGELILAKAKAVLADEFPEIARKVALFLPDEKSRRVGQAVAAASVPASAPREVLP
jgi:predicted NBD/HSP70 family sugar kinase